MAAGAVALLLTGCFGLGIYAGKASYKAKGQPALTQKEPAGPNILYSDIFAQAGQASEGGEFETPAGQVAPAPAGQNADREVEKREFTQAVPQAPGPTKQKAESAAAPAQSQGQAGGKCVYIYDGDTIRVRLDKPDSRLVSVRLLGIDAPELAPGEFGEAARDFVRSLLQSQRVQLVYDNEKYDKYGRTLAYVYLEDGTFINACLLEEGYARVMVIPPNTAHLEEFKALQDKAQKEHCGIWAEPPPKYTWRGKQVVTEWIF